MPSIHQVNHPGSEFSILYRSRNKRTDDFRFDHGSRTTGIRFWNRCKINGRDNSHFRKFLEIEKCRYVDELSEPSREKHGKLRFWGEYEGHSYFDIEANVELSSFGNHAPMAIHRPFFCEQRMNDQNTDPFVFGDVMYYATCRKDSLKNLQSGDLILFGSEFGKKNKKQGIDEAKFYLDTLFVVAEAIPARVAVTFPHAYIESTLRRIGISEDQEGKHPIHTAVRYQDSTRCFSFVCGILSGLKPPECGRPIIDTRKLGLLTPGARTGAKSRELGAKESVEGIWRSIADDVLRQGFVLGIRIADLPVLDALPGIDA